MSLRRGIEPIIATVILVAVALIIAVAVVGYLMGLFGGLTGGQPQISITSVRATTTESNKVKFELYVNNAGAGSDKIIRAELIVGGKAKTTDLNIQIAANQRDRIDFEADAPVSVSPGDTVILKLYFERSGVQTISAVVVSPPEQQGSQSQQGT